MRNQNISAPFAAIAVSWPVSETARLGRNSTILASSSIGIQLSQEQGAGGGPSGRPVTGTCAKFADGFLRLAARESVHEQTDYSASQPQSDL